MFFLCILHKQVMITYNDNLVIVRRRTLLASLIIIINKCNYIGDIIFVLFITIVISKKCS